MKKISRRSFLTASASSTIALVLSACGGNSASTSSATASSGEGSGDIDENAIITMPITGSWDGLCPLASTSWDGDTVCGMIFDPLFDSDGNGGFEGRLAEKFEISDDYTELTAYLHKNAKWHDGEPVTADDVIFTSRLTTKNSFTSSRRLFFQYMEGCDSTGVELSTDSVGVEKVDDYTVRFHYRQPTSLASMMNDAHCFYILPEHLLKDADPATILENDFWVNPVGCGPFVFESNISGDTLTGAANKDYYLGAPRYSKLVIKSIPASNLITAMMSNEVDVIGGKMASINDTDYAMATSIEGYHVDSIEGTGTQFLVVNNQTFKTPKIRKALAMMLDKEKMIQAGCNGNGAPTYSMYTRTNEWVDQKVIDEYGYSFDPDTAYQMLKEEGFDFDRTYTVCISDTAVRQTMMTIMQETWAKYGMKLEIKTMDTPTCISTMREGGCDFWINGSNAANPRDIVASFINWTTVNDDGSFAPFNLAKVSDPTFMNLERELASCLTDEDTKRVTSEIQKLILTDYNYIWLISPFINTALSNRMQDVNMNLAMMGTFDYENWAATL